MNAVLFLSLLFFGDIANGKVYQSFSSIANKAIPGVVNIRTTSYIQRDGVYSDPYQFFMEGRLPKVNKNHSLGSGVVYSSDGYILTNQHVIQGASQIDVLFAKNKRKMRAKVVGIDRKTDLALLKVKASKKLRALEFANSAKLRVGDIVLAIGNPFGFAHTVTSGIISAKGRVLGAGPYDSYLQTDASIHPGNSGGPLVDIRGRVVGINTAVSAKGHGIGFAIPANIVRSVIKDLKKYGKVIRPWAGIVGKNIISNDELGDEYDPTGVYGVIVENLIIDGPAFQAGLRIGDLIMGMDGKKIFDTNELQRRLSIKSPGQRATLKVYRRSKGFQYLNIDLGEIPNAQDLPQEKDLF